ncbi:MAG: shikimate dehydrogenase [Hyphomicrobiales bacterium]|nr:shikimate dehydrogenase [Hyphomicrobiales bacterium]
MNDALPPQPAIDGATRLLGIVGDPIEQVKSPLVFNPRFKAAGKNAVLVPLHVRTEVFEPTLRGLMALGNLDGLIVTVPYKARALALVDEVLPTGRIVGAINAMRREKDGRWTGDMFDGRGLVLGLSKEGISIAARRVMLIGAGGAGSAVAVAFADAGAAALTIHDIDAAKAESLATRLGETYPACATRVGAPQAAGHDVIVNATPIGMAKGEGLPAPIGPLEAAQLVIDVIAKPEVTPLLAEARARGCRTVGGKAMLDGQVAELEKFFRIGG